MLFKEKQQELAQEIEKKKRELIALEEKQSSVNSNNPIAVAEYLHDVQCRWNHTDGCSWYYEKWDSPQATTRKQYLTKAHKLIDKCKELNISIEDGLWFLSL